jgi:hypothetical protein
MIAPNCLQRATFAAAVPPLNAALDGTYDGKTPEYVSGIDCELPPSRIAGDGLFALTAPAGKGAAGFQVEHINRALPAASAATDRLPSIAIGQREHGPKAEDVADLDPVATRTQSLVSHHAAPLCDGGQGGSGAGTPLPSAAYSRKNNPAQ